MVSPVDTLLNELDGKDPPVVREFLEVDGPLEMPKLKDEVDPVFLNPGIHFNVPEEIYHKIPALSNSGIRKVLSSPTLFWDQSWLNEDRDEISVEALTTGKAYHSLILEGPKVYESRFYALPDPADHKDALQQVAEIKDAIIKAGDKPVARVEVDGKTIPAKKQDWVDQLRHLNPSIKVWDSLVARAEKIAGDRLLIKPDVDRQVRIAHRMIFSDPELARAFKGGWPEVTLIYRDPRQGVLMKCRCDYLKIKAIVDLKSYQNSQHRSARQAVLRAIAEHKYTLQPAVYLQAAEAVREMVRENPDQSIFCHGVEDPVLSEMKDWAKRWASFQGEDAWLWVFQQKGSAPITRGFWYRTSGSIHAISQSMIVDGCRTFRECSEIYGTDPWLDIESIDEIGDGDIPNWAVEI